MTSRLTQAGIPPRASPSSAKSLASWSAGSPIPKSRRRSSRRAGAMTRCANASKSGKDEDAGALEEDYKGLVDSVGQWMARQDAGRT